MDDVLDQAVLDELREAVGDPALLERLVLNAATNGSRLVETIVASCRDGDSDGLRRAAHALRGTSGQYGALGVSRRAAAVEHAVISGLTVPVADVDALAAEWSAAAAALRAYVGPDTPA